MKPRAWRNDALAASVLLLAGLIFFWPVIVGNAWLPQGGGDLVSFLYPSYRFAAESLQSGEIPLWNPYLYAGAPFAADNQSGLFYPINLLLFLLRPGFAYFAIEALVMVHIFLAGLGSYLCLRGWHPQAPLSRPAAVVGSLAFMFSDIFIIHIGNLNLIAVAAWLPLALLGLHRSIDAPTWGSRLRWAAAGGAVLGISTLAGHGQATFLLASYLGLYALLRTVIDGRWWAVPLLGFLAITAVATAAVSLFPSLEAVQYTLRGEFDFDRSVGFSLPWRSLLGLFAPGFYGRGISQFWGDWSRVGYGYTGILTWFLAAIAILKRPGRQVIMMAAAGLLFLALALGPNTPLYGWLFEWLPLVPFRAPARFVLLADFSLAFLAAIGLDRLHRSHFSHTQMRAFLAGLAVAAGGILLVTNKTRLVQAGLHPERAGQMNSATLWFAILAGGSWLIIWLFMQSKWSERLPAKWLPLVAIGWLGFDLIVLGHGVEIEPNDPTLGFPVDSPALAFLQSDPGIHRMDIATGEWQPSLPEVERLYSIGGIYNPLHLSNYSVYTGSMGSRGSTLYNLLGVKYVIGDKGAPPGDTNFIIPVFEDDPNVSIYLNTRALPRVAMLFNAQVVADHDTAFAAVHEDDFNPQQTIILEEGQAIEGDPGQSQITVIRYDLNHAAFDVATDKAGYFFLSDIDHPHWSATDNGEPTEILTANYAFRAIYLDPGTHRIEFNFRPPGWIPGLVTTSVTFFLLIITALFQLRRYRQQEGQGQK